LAIGTRCERVGDAHDPHRPAGTVRGTLVGTTVKGEEADGMPSVLIVDDAANIRELVRLYFTAAGFEVFEAPDGPAGLGIALAGGLDVVLLDIMLPGMDGGQVCRSIRECSDVPVIMLTARDTDMDKVSMLEAGADDYVVKPFSPPELVARARALIRRASGALSAPVDRTLPGALTVDAATREVRVDGAPVDLTAKEFDLLAAMFAEPGVVFSRGQLLQSAWGFSEFVDERGIDVHIRHLREKLGDDAVAPRFIETVRGVGYRMRRDAS
jgi:DNA-binding response OmpR family regulator